MIKRNNLIFLLGILFPAMLVFKEVLFFNNPLVWGDAPYFFPEQLNNLVAQPYIWTNWGNNFGGINLVLWLYPLMFVYGYLHQAFGFSNDLILRALFYLPGIVLAFIGPILFSRHLGNSKIVQFFSSLLYGLNTYFILLVDGGQVGVVLAYGLFPVSLWAVKRFFDRANFKESLIAFVLCSLLSIADVRFAAIVLLTGFLWELFNQNFRFNLLFSRLLFLSISLILVNSYWVFPLSNLFSKSELSISGDSSQTSLLHTLFLFQPHWPENVFGKTSFPYFYFVGIPILIFWNLFSKERKMTAIISLVLFFVFLTKGNGEPMGDWYSWFMTNIPFSEVFRDTSKFFAPLILFSGILIGITASRFSELISKFVVFFVWVYLIFLIHPALTGNMNGVLGVSTKNIDFEIVYQKISQSENFTRTLWFPERHPFGFHTNKNQALDAVRLVDERTFATLNVGTFDHFNFLHNEQFLDWFKLLGIKYLVFSGEHRKTLSGEENKDWNSLLELVSKIPDFKREDWGIKFPVYSVDDVKPRIFSVDKLFVVVGSDDIYDKLKDINPQFSISDQGFTFVEDGKLDENIFEKVNHDSLEVLFNAKDELDLSMSFLNEYFISPTESSNSQWAIRSPNEYLKWKYELLVNGVDSKEFDYGKGVAFSTVPNEVIKFELPVYQEGEYILLVRSMRGSSDSSLGLQFSSSVPVTNSRVGSFQWYVWDLGHIKKNKYEMELKNFAGFNVLNIIALVPKSDFLKAQELTRNIKEKFKVVDMQNKNQNFGFSHEVEFVEINPVNYQIQGKTNGNWIVFTDSYDPLWRLKKGGQYLPSYPLYAMINGFYINGSSSPLEIVFKGEELVDHGVWISLFSFLLLAVVFFWKYSKERR